MTVIMTFFYLTTTILLFNILTLTCAMPEQLKRAPDHFCKNMTGHERYICEKLNSEQLRQCSKYLANTLNALCQGMFNGPHDKFDGRHRRKREVANECCRLSCTQSYIIYAYCLHPEKMIKDQAKEIGIEHQNLEPTARPIAVTNSPTISEQNSRSRGEDESKVRKKYKNKHHAYRGRRKRKCGCFYRGKLKIFPRAYTGKQNNSFSSGFGGIPKATRLPPYADDNRLYQ